MLDPRLRRAIVDRLSRGARAVGERGLALLITAGVASCGGATTGPAADASTDQPKDAPVDVGVIVEAPYFDGGSDTGPIIEAPYYDAGTD